ncbi:MAG: hypothetical protein OXC10_19645 [Rhodospirillaceae bacterium]|nr:hypothetical protein [Rhodospirillaceae bacterium]
MEEYDTLEVEADWIDYIRTRLPYSFLKIRRERSGRGSRRRGRRYILSEPVLHVGSEYHNFWRRGYSYYVAGKLTDINNLSSLWVEYRRLLVELTLQDGTPVHPLLIGGEQNYNAMQLEKLWAPVQEDHLNRERVVMTNMCQAIELCLKAVKAHAEYRENGIFEFDDDHDLKRIYESLPPVLVQEIEVESRSFARQYTDFRKAVDDDVMRMETRMVWAWDWERIGDRVESNAYTAILQANDPAVVPDDWFGEALQLLHEHDITYDRYSPDAGRDEYPVKRIHYGLMLGRFLYEHLFPVRFGGQGRVPARFVVLHGHVWPQPRRAPTGQLTGVFFPRR